MVNGLGVMVEDDILLVLVKIWTSGLSWGGWWKTIGLQSFFWFLVLVQELVVFDLEVDFCGGGLLLDSGFWLLGLVCLFWSGILVLDFWALDPTSGAWGFWFKISRVILTIHSLWGSGYGTLAQDQWDDKIGGAGTAASTTHSFQQLWDSHWRLAHKRRTGRSLGFKKRKKRVYLPTKKN